MSMQVNSKRGRAARWSDKEIASLHKTLEALPEQEGKMVFWEELARAHSKDFGIERRWYSLRLKCLFLGIEPKIKESSNAGVIQDLYNTLGGTLADIADRYGVTSSYLAHSRKRGRLSLKITYAMLDDAMEIDSKWEERDARRLQGLHLDD